MRRIIKVSIEFDSRRRSIPTTQLVLDELRDTAEMAFDSTPKVVLISTTEPNFVETLVGEGEED